MWKRAIRSSTGVVLSAWMISLFPAAGLALRINTGKKVSDMVVKLLIC